MFEELENPATAPGFFVMLSGARSGGTSPLPPSRNAFVMRKAKKNPFVGI
ncbi:hypothetical protein EPIB1_3030 [Tritonibacter mobilis]|jgi:hypothetical protein|nr:hypothetical protein [Tritonibacter mobilis]MCA2006643.1 hypothetical protein [Tritonibacter mobilis]MCK5500888.1 hypothetical protein [Tritonibacter mobilis]NKX74589.1 hypothetical protein [Rhodobacteraceae bacterium R_SAG3]VCU60144.1 hypothetical protein EPIB1_3030 [Tritonibacter mobilis]